MTTGSPPTLANSSRIQTSRATKASSPPGGCFSDRTRTLTERRVDSPSAQGVGRAGRAGPLPLDSSRMGPPRYVRPAPLRERPPVGTQGVEE